MSQFISSTILFVIVASAIIHFDIEIPYIGAWIGELPGDLVLKKGGLKIYVPVTSALIASLALTFLESLFKRSK